MRTFLAVGALGWVGGARAQEQAEPVEERSPEEPEVLEVEVRGGRPHPDASAREPGVAGSTLRAERLTQPGVTVADALREEPGVQVSQVGGLGAPATARLRGATAAQTPVYLAGVRINDEVGGVADLSTIPSYLIDRIEIYRSHAPGEAYDLGIGGALFIVPPSVTETEFSVGNTLGSFGTRAIRGHGAVRSGSQHVLAGVEFLAAENDYGFHDSRGTLFVDDDGGPRALSNADASQANVWLTAGDRLGPAHVDVVYHRAGREQGAPKLALVPSERARVDFRRDLFALTTRLPLERWAGELQLSTQVVAAATTIDDPLGELGLLTERTHTPGERVTQLVTANEQPSRAWRLLQQVSLSSERLRRFERRQSTDGPALAARRFSARAAAGAEYTPARWLHLSALGALLCYDTSQTELDACDRAAPTARGGARVSVDDLELFFNAGRYHRVPTLSELYGAAILVRGNPELRPEEGTSLEIGARHQVPRRGRGPLLWTEVSGFVRWSSDLVTYVRTAQGYLAPVNRHASRTLGGEASVGVEPLVGLTLEANISLLDPRDTSDDRATVNDILPFLSRATGVVRGKYVHSFDLDALNAASIGGRMVHQSSRFSDPAGLGVIPAQTFVDLELGFVLLNEVLSVQGRISNVFDARRFDVVGFPLPGRGAFMSMEATW